MMTNSHVMSGQLIALNVIQLKLAIGWQYKAVWTSEMPVFRKFPDFRKFCSVASVQKYRQKCNFRKFATISGFFDNADWHLCDMQYACIFGIAYQIAEN